MQRDKPPYQVHALGEAAVLIWFRGARAGQSLPFLSALADHLRSDLSPTAEDVVPATSSILVTYDPARLNIRAIEEQLRRFIPLLESQSEAPSRTHLVPTAYGGDYGPDLGAVASRHRLSERQIITIHSSHNYRVGFLGFLPGFAYMGPVPLNLATRRLANPRARVPGGSVGVAGRYTGIYPFSSPGGWNLIGKTDLPIWNPTQDPPALFAPGDHIRFTQTASVSDQSPPATRPPEPRFPLFEVESPGALTLIQDKGRVGYAHMGLGRGGVSDTLAAARANSLVHNPPDAAVLELTWTGPSLRALNPTVIALDGADLGCRVDGLAVPTGMSWFVRANSRITFAQTSPSESGARGFLAVPGGFDVPLILGSRSTCLPAGFGGYAGRSLRLGDLLGVGRAPEETKFLAGEYWLPKVDLRLHGRATLHLLPYSGPAGAGARALSAFLEKTWVVSNDADRVGVRLLAEDGVSLKPRRVSVPSFGVVRGAVQLPPGGNPLLLGPDCGTTGGYPLLGVISRSDWPLLAQLRPGDKLQFVPLSGH